MTKETFLDHPCLFWLSLLTILAIAIFGSNELVKNGSSYVAQASNTPAGTVSEMSENIILETPINEIEPYSREWFTYVLYSAKLSNKSSIWTVFLTVGDTDGDVLVQVRFQDKDSALGLGDLIYQKASEYPNETLVLYATGAVHKQVLYFEIPANHELLEMQE